MRFCEDGLGVTFLLFSFWFCFSSLVSHLLGGWSFFSSKLLFIDVSFTPCLCFFIYKVFSFVDLIKKWMSLLCFLTVCCTVFLFLCNFSPFVHCYEVINSPSKFPTWLDNSSSHIFCLYISYVVGYPSKDSFI